MLEQILLWSLFVGAVLYLFGTWNYSHWKDKGVPFVPSRPWPFVGSMLDAVLYRKSFPDVIEDVYRKGAGHPFIGFYQFLNPVLALRDPELIKTVLVKDFSSFHDNSFTVHEELDPLVARNPFFLKGEQWKAVRSLLTPAFTVGKIKPQISLMATVCKDLVEYLEKEAPKGKPDGLEAKEVAAKYTTDVVATCAFGISGNSLKDPDAELRRMGRDLMATNFFNNIKVLILFILPNLAKIVKIRFSSVEISNFFRRIIKEVVTYREQHNVVRNDYLQMLMQIKNKGRVDGDDADVTVVRSGGVDLKYTHEDITAHALTFFIDGFETTSVALSFTLYELAVNPEVQDRLRAEVDSVLKKYNGELCHEAIQEMQYLDMVLNETLRLHSPAPVTDRVCTKNYQLPLPSGGTLTLEKGAIISIPIQALHLDPENFPNPKKFDPERFSPERKNEFKKGAFMPFGDGPRQCLGMKFGLTQAKAAVVTVVSNFYIKPTSKTPIPLVLDISSFLPTAKGGLWLDFIKRTDV